MRALAAALLLTALAVAPAAQSARVRLGIDVLLDERVELVRGKRVGLITNPSGVDADLVPTVDRLARDPRVRLVHLFAPEHGIRGEARAGEEVGREVDPVTDLPVESLYGSSRRPSREALGRIDVLLFDLQDVGSRTYTYVSTLGEAMAAAGEAGVPFVVLDRPNPHGGELVEGPIREERWKSFVGWGPVPVLHGLTVGELARLYQGEMGIRCELTVVPMRGWSRDMQWEDTGLVWVQTSPHVPHALHARLYPATGMVGGLAREVGEGVGYTLPFETIAAEFLDPAGFAATMESAGLPGVRFLPVSYVPFYGAAKGRSLRGVRLVVTDRRAFRPLRTAIALMCAVEGAAPGRAGWEEGRTFAIHWGNDRILDLVREGKSADVVAATWEDDVERFRRTREKYLLYR